MAYLEEEFSGTNVYAATPSSFGINTLSAITINATVGGDLTFDGKNDLDLTSAGASGFVGTVLFTDSVNVGSGTGNYNTFLAIQDNNDPGDSEAGFNTIDTPPLDGSNLEIDHAKTEPVLLGSLVTTVVDGVEYYEFRVDLNEANSGINSQISLDQFILYASPDGTIQTLGTLQGSNVIYNMDNAGFGDISVLLSEAGSSGSGTDDYSVLVPTSMFSGYDLTTTWIYLFAEMGAAGAGWGVNGGFEEWNIQKASIVTGTKFEDLNGDGIRQDGEGPIAGVKIYIDANKNGEFDAGERFTFTDANGRYTFGGVVVPDKGSATLWIDEVVPAGYVQTTGPYEVVTIDSKSPINTIVTVDPIGNRPLVPSILLVKDVSGLVDGADAGTAGNDGAGDKIVYMISATNNGELALTNVVVTDPNADAGSLVYVSGDGGVIGVMEVGETWIYTATHTITQAELDGKGIDAAGAIDGDSDIDNLATVNADSVRGPVTDSDPAEQVIQYLPSFTVLKAVTSITDGADFGASGKADSDGDVIHYSVTIVNTGNITLTGFTYSDLNADGDTLTWSDQGNGDGNLDVGETWLLTGTHTVSQAELDSKGSDDTGALDTDGDVDNKVTVDFAETDPKSSSVETPLVYQPDFTVQKAVTSITDGADYGGTGQADSDGDVIHYSVTIINTGNITLTNFTYTDLNADGDTLTWSDQGNGDGNLDVGETWVLTGTHTVTQAEIDSTGSDNTGALDTDGDIDNKVTVDFAETDPKSSSVMTPITLAPSIALEKYVSVNPGTGYLAYDPADSVTGPQTSFNSDAMFKVEVTNDGNMTLTGLSFADILSSPVSPSVALDYGALGAMVDTDGNGTGDVLFSVLDAADGTSDNVLGTVELAPGETINIFYSLPFTQGQHTNTVYVDSDQTGVYKDAANYYGLVNDGAGVRTPGFWQNPNNGLLFWDGISGNERHEGPSFPDGDLLYAMHRNGDTSGNGTVGPEDQVTAKGLLIGDYNMNGFTDAGEDTIFIPYNLAVNLVSGGGGSNAGNAIGRDTVAAWLNYLNGNNIGDAGDTNSPHHFLDDAVDWLQEFMSNGHDADLDFAVFQMNNVPKNKGDAWKKGAPDADHSGSDIHNALDSYNNDGTINGHEYAGDADNSAFLFALSNLATVAPQDPYFAKYGDMSLANFASDDMTAILHSA